MSQPQAAKLQTPMVRPDQGAAYRHDGTPCLRTDSIRCDPAPGAYDRETICQLSGV